MICLCILAVLAGIHYHTKSSLKLISLYIFFSVASEAGFLITALNGLKNWWLLDIYIVVEYALVGTWCVKDLDVNFKLKRSIPYFLALCGLILLLITIFKPYPPLLNVYFQKGLLFIFSGIYLIDFIKKDYPYPLLEDARMWIAGGLFLRFSLLLLVFTITAFIANPELKKQGIYFSYFLSTINLVTYLIYCKAYLCKRPLPTI